MKLTDIKNIETLNVAQSQTVKGGGRDTRTDQANTPSTFTGGTTTTSKKK